MLTNANKDTYLVKNRQKYANVIYEWPLTLKKGSSCKPHFEKCVFERELAKLAAFQVESLEKPEGTFTKVLALLDIVQL